MPMQSLKTGDPPLHPNPYKILAHNLVPATAPPWGPARPERSSVSETKLLGTLDHEPTLIVADSQCPSGGGDVPAYRFTGSFDAMRQREMREAERLTTLTARPFAAARVHATKQVCLHPRTCSREVSSNSSDSSAFNLFSDVYRFFSRAPGCVRQRSPAGDFCRPSYPVSTSSAAMGSRDLHTTSIYAITQVGPQRATQHATWTGVSQNQRCC